MKWLTHALLIVLIGLLFFGLGQKNIVYTTVDDSNSLSVSANAKKSVMPDEATVRILVETKADNAKTAQDENTKIMKNVMQELEELGDLETTGYYISPLRDWNPDTRTYEEKGFRVSNNINILLSDIEKAGVVLEKAVKAGATSIKGIQFSISEERSAKIKEELYSEAGAKAKQKAELMASGLNAKLGEVVKISESGSYSPIQYARAESAMSDAVDVEAGDIDVSVTLNVEYSIK